MPQTVIIHIGTLLAIAAIIIIVIILRRQAKRKRRETIRHKPFPPEWEEILNKNITIYPHLPDNLKQQLHSLINVFLDEKLFEGCGELEITDEIRVTIAAEACMLMLNREPHYYPTLRSILVYPHAYSAKQYKQVGNVYIEEPSGRLGESWTGGNVVLAWDHVKAGAHNFDDGHNVVLHEFAHQLDQEDGSGNGVPILEKRSSYISWARVFNKEYQQLVKDTQKHRKNVMDTYGATNPAEFFAVATETFFEKPRQLKKKEPELYEQLKGYYQVNPLEWL